MKIKEVVSALERFAPLPLQDGFDNAGMQIGLTDAETTGALLCLDVTESVLDEAISLGCNLVISHHPLIFRGYKSITGRDYVERCIMKAIKNDIVVYSAHTNLDNAVGGVNYKIAEKIGLKNISFLSEKEDSLLKLVTFVPVAQSEIVREALFNAGCGHISSVGELHRENELRIETILPAYKKSQVLKALITAHPYEEPAFDFYPLKNSWKQAGSGIIGELEKPETELDFLKRVKKIFEVDCLKHNKLSGRLIEKVALCGGSGAFLLPQAIARQADVFITGEMKYHEYFGHESDLLIAEIGHYESEQYTKEIFYSIIKGLLPNFDLHYSKVNTNPIKYL
ncbi:Nif3-like dinuclear metal center hexameric protein [Bacteroides sp. 224]|uniref:Nif3-like dinuclear metal center hexameric protein n=1 Tax=Bacteroides sp. 224 TaxID=2302936 RepID=UPI0013D254C5|nr:Nif3-like dinuclear metal center hexameric protein [Bacteroides sp. 224]NDV64436.1 Nif3-like dinuclear metal center hexameric protein [Bacteroides sp. 224]